MIVFWGAFLVKEITFLSKYQLIFSPLVDGVIVSALDFTIIVVCVLLQFNTLSGSSPPQ